MELTSGFGFSMIMATPDMIGKSLEQAGFANARDKYGASVVAIRRGRDPILSPSKDEILIEGDAMVIAAPEDTLENLGTGR